MIPVTIVQASAAEAPFAPTDIAGLAAWYDASDTATITDAGGGAVSAWADKSGNGFTATEATNRPITGTRTINGLNVLDFDGSNDLLSSSLPADDITQTLFAVVEIDDFAGNFRTILGANLSGGWCFRINQTTGAMQTEKQATAAIQTGVAVATATPYILLASTGTTISKQQRSLEWVNGSQTTHAQTLTAGRTAVIGCTGTTLPFDGKIAEIIVYSETLDVVEIGQVTGYLSDKWAITN